MRIGAMIAAAIAAYWPASRLLWHYWIEHPYFAAHAVLVAVLALWLLYRVSSRVAAAPVRAQPWLLLPLVLCSVASFAFASAGRPSAQLLLLPVLILLAVGAAFGTAVTRLIAVPLGFLYFAMPVWEFLVEPLQNLTLAIVRLVAPAIGLPLTVSGSLISLPGGVRFTVTEWCSGQGVMVQGLAVATLLGELEHAPLARRLRLLASMVPVALLTNWIRVLTIIQVGYATGMRHVLVTRYHVQFGYVLYAVALALFVWVATLTRRALPHSLEMAPGGRQATPPESRQYVAALLALICVPVVAGVVALFRR